MKTYTLAYGRSTCSADLPEDHVIYEIKGCGAPVADDGAAAVRKAVRSRDGGKKALADIAVNAGQRIVIVVSDGTRNVHTPLMLDAVMEELHRGGVQDGQITLLVATGTHRPATDEELQEICGPHWRHLSVVQHDCRDETCLTYVGTTSRGNAVYINRLAAEADVLIVTGGISFHDMAGFSGGRKAIVPGIAGYDTIMRNHSLALNDEAQGGCNPACDAARLEGNPMHEDMVEGAAFVQPDYMVNTVLAADGSVCAAAAGHWLDDWRRGCRLLMEADSVRIGEQADVIIASAGGYPKDVNFYQATKAHMNAVFAVKPGGIMILVMECPDIGEPPDFADAFLLRGKRQIERKLREHFTIPAFSAYKTQEIIRSMRAVYVVTRRENFGVMRQSGQIPVLTLEEAWQSAQELLHRRNIKDYTIGIMPYAASTLPIWEKGK